MRKLAVAAAALAAVPGLALAAVGGTSPVISPLASLAAPADTVSGQPVRMSVSRLTLEPGASLPERAAPRLRYIYVVSGRLQVSNLVTGGEQEVGAGEFAVETEGEWHTGRALGAEPAHIMVIDQVAAEAD